MGKRFTPTRHKTCCSQTQFSGSGAKNSSPAGRKKWRTIVKMLRMVLLILLVAFSSRCETQTAAHPKKHLLVLGEEKGYRHEAVSHAIATIERLGRETGLWTTTI